MNIRREENKERKENLRKKEKEGSERSTRECRRRRKKKKKTKKKPKQHPSCNTTYPPLHLKQGLIFAICKNEHAQCKGNIITFALFHARVKFYASMVYLGHMLGPVTMHGWLGLAQPHGPGWT